MTNLFTIQNDTVIIDKLAVTEIQGNIAIHGNPTVNGAIDIRGNIVTHDILSREITTDSLRVKNLIADTTNFGNWHAKTYDELNGKGINWNCNEGITQLVYRTGNRIWSNANFDVSSELSYMIDGVPVLSSNTLGRSVTSSNLRQVGALTALSVIGAASIGGFAYFNNMTYRLGLGTDEPNSSISIIDNNVEISIGSPSQNLATFGTWSNHDVAIITDNIPRLTVKHSGEVQIGEASTKTGILRVYGSIYANEIVADTRLQRSSSLEFSNDIYDKGLVWKDDTVKKLILMNDPSRLWSSESIDIAAGQSYYVNGSNVISETSLGNTILHSSLITVGELSDLTVKGLTTVSEVNASLISFNSKLTISSTGILSSDTLMLVVNDTTILSANESSVSIGSNQLVKINGSLAIGVNNPDPLVNLSVNGVMSFNNKKFMSGTEVPSYGMFAKGDICWNDDPTVTGYVGWVCVQTGTPGEWKPFGLIGA